MKKHTRSLLEELSSIGKRTSTFDDHLIEANASNLITSCINVLEKINEHYDPDTASDLQRKFMNSIRTGDVKKFQRSMQRIIESKNK